MKNYPKMVQSIMISSDREKQHMEYLLPFDMKGTESQKKEFKNVESINVSENE